MAIITKNDWVPRYLDAGYGELLSQLALQNLSEAGMVSAINSAGSLPDINEAMLYELIAEWKADDPGIVVLGANLPQASSRPPAVAGVNQDGAGLWFDAPSVNVGDGDTMTRWYVNGDIHTEVRLDLTVNRYMTKAALGVQAGDVVQICVVGENGIVGRWGRAVIS